MPTCGFVRQRSFWTKNDEEGKFIAKDRLPNAGVPKTTEEHLRMYRADRSYMSNIVSALNDDKKQNMNSAHKVLSRGLNIEVDKPELIVVR
jgi:hypothetical protein